MKSVSRYGAFGKKRSQRAPSPATRNQGSRSRRLTALQREIMAEGLAAQVGRVDRVFEPATDWKYTTVVVDVMVPAFGWARLKDFGPDGISASYVTAARLGAAAVRAGTGGLDLAGNRLEAPGEVREGLLDPHAFEADIDGLDDAIIGTSAGESKDFNSTLLAGEFAGTTRMFGMEPIIVIGWKFLIGS